MPVDHVVRQAECHTEPRAPRPDTAQGSSSFRPSVSGRPPSCEWLLIVIAFLVWRRPIRYVGIDRALRQPLRLLEFAGLAREHLDELGGR